MIHGRYFGLQQDRCGRLPGPRRHDEKEIMMDEQTTVAIYALPVLVELGKFGEDTLGGGETEDLDGEGYFPT
ncbi:MAG: hypothetical protein ACRDS9_23210 [Pseudonocardiaceae bacterium]